MATVAASVAHATRIFCMVARPGRRLVQQRLRCFSAVTAQQEQPRAAARAGQTLELVATASQATRLLAHFFAADLQPADCYLLYGGVGAGKSYFSRAFIRAAAQDEMLPVPSPTFLLQNMYDDHEGPPIYHYDLYRLTAPHDLARLDLPATLPRVVSLIEWPERLGGSSSCSDGGGSGGGSSVAPAEHLAISISVLNPAEQQQLAAQGIRAPEEEEEDSSVEEDDGDEEGSSSGSNGSGGAVDMDTRWRRIVLSSSGARWEGRLLLLQSTLQQLGAGDAVGCWLLQASSGASDTAAASGLGQ